jgi:flagellar assembly protein FliH
VHDAFSSTFGSGVLLFDDDFDIPPRESEPEVIEPLFTAAELHAARNEAASESRDATLAEIDTTGRATACLALTEIARQIAAARADAVSIAEQSSEAIARLLLDCFAATLPALSARHGPDEIAAVLRQILPVLHSEPKIVVRVNPDLVAALTEEFLSHDGDLAARVRLLPTGTVALGDARINWENGSATRDTAALWTQIENILAPAGLLNARPTTKGHGLGE